MKLFFIPVSVIAGIIAGFVGRKTFEQLWGVIDTEEPPQPDHKEASWGKVLAAAALEGAVFRATRAAVDRGSRVAFEGATGTWPGEQRPEPE